MPIETDLSVGFAKTKYCCNTNLSGLDMVGSVIQKYKDDNISVGVL